jgi:hypothetical protein
MKSLSICLCQRSQENVKDPIFIAKFFNPTGTGTWYVTEYDPIEHKFFGYASIFGDWSDEWGYFSLDVLEAYRGRFGLGIERDLYFEGRPITKLVEDALDLYFENQKGGLKRMNYQKLILVGNATGDAQNRQSKKGDVTHTTFSLAVGSIKDPSNFLPVIVFGKAGQLARERITKSHQVLVEGRVELSRISRLNVVADKLQLGPSPAASTRDTE